MKSEWKELPDWTNPDDYAFLDNATPEVWAWEFLRRNPEYKKDWENYIKSDVNMNPSGFKLEQNSNKIKKLYAVMEKEGIHYFPPPKGNIELYANKWCLNWFYDPQKQYQQGVKFIKVIPFPQHIYLAEDMDEFLVDKEMGNTNALIVKEDFVALVFDFSYPITKQLQIAKKTLNQLIKRYEATEKEEDAVKPSFWKRHLRVLDAQRTIPSITDYAISAQLGKEENKGAKKDKANKEGKNYITAAQGMLLAYRKILWHNLVPKKNTPKKLH